MKKVLVTGFDPFGGQTVNPAWEAVRSLPDALGGLSLSRLMVPTVFGEAARLTIEEAERLRPDAVVCVGQAGGRAAVTPEMIAVNLRFGTIPDNAGQRFADTPVLSGAPTAYFSTLPVRAMAEAIRQRGLPGAVSYSAGAFVCNDLFYLLAHHFSGTAVKTGFIHVPFLPEQTDAGRPSMPLDDIAAALSAALSALE